MNAGCLAQINQIIGELEGSFRAQSDAYKNLCSVIKDEMSEKLAHRKITIYEGLSSKHRRVREALVE